MLCALAPRQPFTHVFLTPSVLPTQSRRPSRRRMWPGKWRVINAAARRCFVAMMHDGAWKEPTERQVLELQGSSSRPGVGVGSSSHQARHLLGNSRPASHHNLVAALTHLRQRVNPGSAHIVSLAYDHPDRLIRRQQRPSRPPCVEEGFEMITTVSSACLSPAHGVATTTTMTTSTTTAAVSGFRLRQPQACTQPLHLRSPQLDLTHHHNASAAFARAALTYDQSFPVMDPLLSYTHETYLGTPSAAAAECLTCSPAFVRLRPSSRGNSLSASINGGDGGSLDGFEWDNYDETQIKPEHDEEDDEEWLNRVVNGGTVAKTVSTAAAVGTESGVEGTATAAEDEETEEAEESFAEVFKHRPPKGDARKEE